MLGNLLDQETTAPFEIDVNDLLNDPDFAAAQSENVAEAATRLSSRSTARVNVRPASTSHRTTEQISGECREASASGIRLASDRPPAVGDVYLLSFEESPYTCESVFARCLHCRLVREDTFDAGFTFFSEQSLRDS